MQLHEIRAGNGRRVGSGEQAKMQDKRTQRHGQNDGWTSHLKILRIV
jgi:hypothetical protein